MSRNYVASAVDRRRFLRGVGWSLALPAFQSFLRSPAIAQTVNAPQASRFVCVAPDYGVHPESFFPQQSGGEYQMPPVLAKMERHRRDFSVFSKLDHPDVGGGHGCTKTLLNGMKSADADGDRRKLLSLDQVIANQIGTDTRFPAMITGHGAPVAYTRAGIPVPAIANPIRFFDLLFVDDDKKTKARRRQSLNDNASILDVLLQDSRSLKTQLAVHDRNKLDEYLTAVRETERKLVRRQNWLDIPRPKGKLPKTDDEEDDYNDPYDMSLFYEIMVMALQTESTRVLVYQMPGGNRLFPFDGVTMGYHTLTHHGRDPERVKQLQIIDAYYLSNLARFIDRLKNTTDEMGRSLLDTTIVMFASGMGNASSHSSRNLPALVAGGGLKHGKHHVFPKNGSRGTPLCNLFVTLLQQLGIETDRFASSKGNLNHLLM
jgi:hypothetical protein